jgi:Domain of unknown function (DUF4384)
MKEAVSALEVPMLSALAISLLLPALSPAAPRHIRSSDPPIRVKLSEDNYARGDRAKVRVRAAEDGYLLVLRADAEGRIRVLFPIDPTDPGRITGGHDFEVRGRGDREAFVVSEREGSGTVIAAVSAEPFQYDAYTRAGHWDYRALAADSSGDDAEATLVDLVDRMSGGHFDYDVATYSVSAAYRTRHYSAGWYDPWYPGFYSPYYPYYPWYYGPRVGFRATIGFGFGRGHHWHR